MGFWQDRSRCYNSKDEFLKYFDELTDVIKLSKGVPKSIAGVEENTEVIPEYQLA